ncbi:MULTISPECIES: hypothetical protein [unclassified Microcoleus]|uniref:hypothetical protein n=1 Tax=unclassified Microcoleus TaxID=2642155 RepID=UPI002FD56041
MPSLYTENSEKWKNLASIDYFTQFVKAWITFNAWYKNSYPTLKTDREAIKAIKADPNTFRNKLVSLLNNQGNDGVAFKSRIAELHLELERKHIFNKSERINFESIVIEENPDRKKKYTRQQLTYKVERNIPGKPHKEVQIDIICRNGSVKFSYTQTNGFNVDDLISQNGFRSLSEPQQNNLKAYYEEINPSKPINLLSHERNNCIPMGNLYFVKNTDHLCKGIIEILYKLRNVLFHGEIIPDSDTNKVYEHAYQILYTLIQAL